MAYIVDRGNCFFNNHHQASFGAAGVLMGNIKMSSVVVTTAIVCLVFGGLFQKTITVTDNIDGLIEKMHEAESKIQRIEMNLKSLRTGFERMQIATSKNEKELRDIKKGLMQINAYLVKTVSESNKILMDSQGE